MNEQANTQLVQQAYQSIKAGDIQSLLHSFAGDVQWELPVVGGAALAIAPTCSEAHSFWI